MSRSKRKPYYKDKPDTRNYWRTLRREWKQDLNANYADPNLQLRLSKEIINDYDYRDYWFMVTLCHENDDFQYWTSESVAQYSRK